jgi:2'-5' RNA ligase
VIVRELIERRKTGCYVSLQYTVKTRKALVRWINQQKSIEKPLKLQQFHSTIIYSRTNILNVKELCAAEDLTGWSEITPTGFDLFDSSPPDPDVRVLVIRLHAPSMMKLNALLEEHGGVQDRAYNPHLTLSYEVTPAFDVSALEPPDIALEPKDLRVEELNFNWDKE